MSYETIKSQLDDRQQAALDAIKRSAETLLNHSPRFKFFTLHGSKHLENLFDILAMLQKGGITLRREELFLLGAAICVHDLGMVTTLRDQSVDAILDGRPAATDPAAVELFLRETHHNLVDAYLSANLQFVINLGVTIPELGQIVEISRCHRKVILQTQPPLIRYLGSLLRVIDELDLAANRAPANVFLNIIDEMDATSCWHWFKHNITEPWSEGHTVHFIAEGSRKRILFQIAVRPSKASSIDYWLTQLIRPIKKALIDDDAAQIIREHSGILIECETNKSLSKPNNLGARWAAIEEQALSANRKVVLVIDDEFRKLEDLFYPIMDHFHVISSSNAKDAFTKLEATRVDLAIVDLQIGSGSLWKDHETDDFKRTGLKICAEIQSRFSKTKIALLSGTRYSIELHDLKPLNLAFFLRKPVDPQTLLKEVQNALIQ